MKDSFLWFDLETFGRNPRQSRIAQFAGLRTNAELEVIDEPLMLYCQPALDLLPSPEATLITGITPQRARSAAGRRTGLQGTRTGGSSARLRHHGRGLARLSPFQLSQPTRQVAQFGQRRIAPAAHVIDDARDMLRLELRQCASFSSKAFELLVVGLPRKKQTNRNTLVELGVESLDEDPVSPTENGPNPEFSGHQAARANFVRSHVSQRSR
jgi:hypothetical protein